MNRININKSKLQTQQNYRVIWKCPETEYGTLLYKEMLIREYIKGTMEAQGYRVGEIIIKRKIKEMSIIIQIEKGIKHLMLGMKHKLRNITLFKYKNKINIKKDQYLIWIKHLMLGMEKKTKRLKDIQLQFDPITMKGWNNNGRDIFETKNNKKQLGSSDESPFITLWILKRKEYKRIFNTIINKYKNMNQELYFLQPLQHYDWVGLNHFRRIYLLWITSLLIYIAKAYPVSPSFNLNTIFITNTNLHSNKHINLLKIKVVGTPSTPIASTVSTSAITKALLYFKLHPYCAYLVSSAFSTYTLFLSLLLFSFANLGLPLTANFIGEFLSLLAIFQYNPFIVLLATTGVIFSAAYSLFLYNRVSFGSLNPYLSLACYLFISGILIAFDFVPAIAYLSLFSTFTHCLGTLATSLTAFYSFRLIYIVFINTPNSSFSPLHEPVLPMMFPLVFIAFCYIFVDYLFKDLFVGLGFTWTMLAAEGVLPLASVLPALVIFAMSGLELTVAVIQAYVFTILSSLRLVPSQDSPFFHSTVLINSLSPLF